MDSYGAINGTALNVLAINEGTFTLSASASATTTANAAAGMVRRARVVQASVLGSLAPDFLCRRRRLVVGSASVSGVSVALLRRRVHISALATGNATAYAVANARLVASAALRASLSASSALFWKFRLSAPPARIIRVQKQHRTVPVAPEHNNVLVPHEEHKLTIAPGPPDVRLPSEKRVVTVPYDRRDVN